MPDNAVIQQVCPVTPMSANRPLSPPSTSTLSSSSMSPPLQATRELQAVYRNPEIIPGLCSLLQSSPNPQVFTAHAHLWGSHYTDNHIAVLLCSCTYILLYCHTAVLPYCCTAVLLYCHTAVLPCCCTAVLLCCYIAVRLVITSIGSGYSQYSQML